MTHTLKISCIDKRSRVGGAIQWLAVLPLENLDLSSKQVLVVVTAKVRAVT